MVQLEVQLEVLPAALLVELEAERVALAVLVTGPSSCS